MTKTTTLAAPPTLLLPLLAVLTLSTAECSAFEMPTAIRDVAEALRPKSVPVKEPAVAGVDKLNEEFPWRFTGRLWFRPALVPVPLTARWGAEDPPPPPLSVSVLSLFGWTVGGTVVLEYDESPVGPYREYVSMGAVVSKRGTVGQWGSRLYVSTEAAQSVCEDIWGVPALLADIDFLDDEEGDRSENGGLRVVSAPVGRSAATTRQDIKVSGWGGTRIDGVDGMDGPRYPSGGLPVLWTPTIKALWAPLVLLPAPEREKGFVEEVRLPMHRLRLSAGAMRLRFCGQSRSEALGLPFGVGLVLDNVLIEISRREGFL